MMNLVVRSSDFWNVLPNKFRDEVDFAKAITKLSLPLAKAIFKRLPALSNDREFWIKIVKDIPQAGELVNRNAPIEILADQEVMILAFNSDQHVLGAVDASLWHAKNFVEHVLTSNDAGITCIPYVPHGTQLMWPDFIAQSFSRLPTIDLMKMHSLGSSVAKELWQNRDVVIAWFSSGGSFF